MASNSNRTRSVTQIRTPQGHKSSAMSHTTCWDYSNSHCLEFSDCQGPYSSYHSRHTAQEIPSRSLQQRTPFSGPQALSPSLFVTRDELSNKIDCPYQSSLMSQDHTAASSTENGRRNGTENYAIQAWQYPYIAEDQTSKQNLGYFGQQQYSEGSYQHSSQPMQSGTYLTSSEDTHPPQQYNPSYIPPSYLDPNRMPSIASPGRSYYHPFMTAVTRPRIVVDEAQDDPTCSQGDRQSSIYQDCLGTNISSASRRGASVGLNAQRSLSRTPSRNHRRNNDIVDASDLEESAEGKLNVPRTPRRGQREDGSQQQQQRRRHLTPEGREHAKEVRKKQACKECRRKKIKVCLVWSSGFALLLTFPESSANMYLREIWSARGLRLGCGGTHSPSHVHSRVLNHHAILHLLTGNTL